MGSKAKKSAKKRTICHYSEDDREWKEISMGSKAADKHIQLHENDFDGPCSECTTCTSSPPWALAFEIALDFENNLDAMHVDHAVQNSVCGCWPYLCQLKGRSGTIRVEMNELAYNEILSEEDKCCAGCDWYNAGILDYCFCNNDSGIGQIPVAHDQHVWDGNDNIVATFPGFEGLEDYFSSIVTNVVNEPGDWKTRIWIRENSYNPPNLVDTSACVPDEIYDPTTFDASPCCTPTDGSDLIFYDSSLKIEFGVPASVCVIIGSGPLPSYCEAQQNHPSEPYFKPAGVFTSNGGISKTLDFSSEVLAILPEDFKPSRSFTPMIWQAKLFPGDDTSCEALPDVFKISSSVSSIKIIPTNQTPV